MKNQKKKTATKKFQASNCRKLQSKALLIRLSRSAKLASIHEK